MGYAVNPDGKAPLKPFKSGQEMLDKTVAFLKKLIPNLQVS